MIGRPKSLLDIRRRPVRAAALLGMLALVGLGVYHLGWHLWARAHVAEARRALARRDFAPARAHLELCLQVWRDRPDLHLLAAQAARQAGDFEEALDHLNQCRELQGEQEDV